VSAPRLEIDLGRLQHNAITLVRRLARQGISVSGVSKAVLGLPEIVHLWLAAGVSSIGDSRLETIEAMAHAGITAPLLLIRTPMLSQVERVVAHAATSCNSEPVVIKALAAAALRQRRRHGVLLMVELGDLREGILPPDLTAIAELTLGLPSLRLVGIGSNLGCQHGVAADADNMGELSALANALEARFGISLELISGGIPPISPGWSKAEHPAGSTICAWARPCCWAANPWAAPLSPASTPTPSSWWVN